MRKIGKKVDVSAFHDFCWNTFGFEFSVHYWPNRAVTRHKSQLTIFVHLLWWSGHLSFDWGKRDYKMLRELKEME